MAGRPRNPKIDTAVWQVANELLHTGGYRAFSVEVIARRVGVAKTTIYTRWPTRDALLDAVLSAKITVPERHEPEARNALLELVRDDLELARSIEGRAVAQFMLATKDPDGPEATFVAKALDERRGQYRVLLTEAVPSRDEPTMEFALDFMLGAVWASAVLRCEVGPHEAERLVDAVLRLIS